MEAWDFYPPRSLARRLSIKRERSCANRQVDPRVHVFAGKYLHLRTDQGSPTWGGGPQNTL